MSNNRKNDSRLGGDSHHGGSRGKRSNVVDKPKGQSVGSPNSGSLLEHPHYVGYLKGGGFGYDLAHLVGTQPQGISHFI